VQLNIALLTIANESRKEEEIATCKALAVALTLPDARPNNDDYVLSLQTLLKCYLRYYVRAMAVGYMPWLSFVVIR
jgi:hypothetical protein